MADKTKIEITVTMVPKMIMAVRYIFMKNFLKMCFNHLCKKLQLKCCFLKNMIFQNGGGGGDPVICIKNIYRCDCCCRHYVSIFVNHRPSHAF